MTDREGYATLTARVTAKDRADFAAVADSWNITPSALLNRCVRRLVERKAGVMDKIAELRRLRAAIDDAVDRAVAEAVATSGRRPAIRARSWPLLDDVIAAHAKGDIDLALKLIAAQQPHIAGNLWTRLERERPEVCKELDAAKKSTIVDTAGR